MLLKSFYDEQLAQASYMVGCQATGEALVIDPSRHIEPYLRAAAAEGLRIAHVTETHIHADYVSGSRELVRATGARLYLSAEGGLDWQYAFSTPDTTLLHDGDVWQVGNVRIQALHTPGHTPEHLVFMFTDTLAADQPMGIFTGDLLFVGDVGRPDLLEEAAGITGTKEPGARQQFQNVQRLKAMPDYLMVLPGHGAGSACGKALGAVPSSTLGYEKLFNPAFQIADEDEFVRWLLDGQPEPPTYFAEMKRVNKAGPVLLAELPEPEMLEGFILEELTAEGVTVLDARLPIGAPGFIPGTLIVPPTNQFNTYAGWIVDYRQPVYLIADGGAAPKLVRELRAAGIDDVRGFFNSDAVENYVLALPCAEAPDVSEAVRKGAVIVLDVRNHSEFEAGHIPNSVNILYGLLPRYLEAIPRDQPVLVVCAGGTRSLIATSLLLKAGFTQVTNLNGGFDAWRAAGLPVAVN
ncbi:MAG: MBL fold metallo-hydrolase [Anaerolineae bacterium]|nr:MBL fold metallo-hydrolase [Anaerolineae bacterium]